MEEFSEIDHLNSDPSDVSLNTRNPQLTHPNNRSSLNPNTAFRSPNISLSSNPNHSRPNHPNHSGRFIPQSSSVLNSTAISSPGINRNLPCNASMPSPIARFPKNNPNSNAMNRPFNAPLNRPCNDLNRNNGASSVNVINNNVNSNNVKTLMPPPTAAELEEINQLLLQFDNDEMDDF